MEEVIVQGSWKAGVNFKGECYQKLKITMAGASLLASTTKQADAVLTSACHNLLDGGLEPPRIAPLDP